MNGQTKPKIAFFWSSPMNLLARIEIRITRFRHAPPGYKRAPRARIVRRKEANGLYPRGVIWDEDLFLVFTPEFEEKIYMCPPEYFVCLPNIFSAPPSQSRYSGAGLASPNLPFLLKPSPNSPMLEKSKVQKAK